DFFSHWYNAAILEILSQEDAKDDPKWIAKRLLPRVPPSKIEKSLALLQQLGYLTMDLKRGRLVLTQANVRTGSEVYGTAIASFHQQMIELGKESITRIPP